jgi:DNA-binding NarL/FixJ family response regulator
VSAPRVLLADADELMLARLRLALTAAGFEVVGEVASAEAAVEAAGSEAPALVLVSSRLPGGGIDAVRRIAALWPSIELVVLADRPSGDELLDAVLAGASGYLAPEMRSERLAPALHAVLAGEVALPRRHTRRVLDELRGRSWRREVIAARASAPVTGREWEVLDLLVDGASSSQIARRLGISEVTVRRHASTVVAKLGLPDRAAAVRLMAERSAR